MRKKILFLISSFIFSFSLMFVSNKTIKADESNLKIYSFEEEGTYLDCDYNSNKFTIRKDTENLLEGTFSVVENEELKDTSKVELELVSDNSKEAEVEKKYVIVDNETMTFEYYDNTQETSPSGNEDKEPEGGEEKDPGSEDVEPEKPVFPCSVVVKNSPYGDLVIDVLEGNVGDVVTIYAKPYVFCTTSSVTANNIDLQPDEEGYYKFTLVEGENVVEAKFVVDNDKLKGIITVFDDVRNNNWGDIFNVKNLLTIIGYAISVFLSSGYFITLLKSKRIKAETVNEFTSTAKDVMESEIGKALNTFLQETFKPVMETMNNEFIQIKDICNVLTRCFILSQEGTPESRLAIIQELTKADKSKEELSAQVRDIINQEINKNEEIQRQKKEAIESLEKSNDEIVEKNEKETGENPNAEGRY